MRNSQLVRRARRLILAAAFVGCSLTGCGSGKDSATGTDDAPWTAPSKPAAAPRPVHDPPAKFAAAGSPMPDEATTGRLTMGGTLNSAIPVTLYKATAYVAAPDHVQAVDTATGHVTATVEPEGAALSETGSYGNDNPAVAPALVTVGGKPTVVTPFLVKRSGSGTQAGHKAVEVTGLDANTAKVLWRLTLRLPDWADTTYDDLTATAVGADQAMGAVMVSAGEDAVTYGIDLAAHRRVWTQDGFRATAVAGGVVAGTTADDLVHERAVGYEASTGRRRWLGGDSYELAVYAAGPGLVLAQGRDYGSGASYHRLLNAATGATKWEMPAELAGSSCVYDEKSVLVCHGSGSQGLVAYGLDASSGKVLWQLPDKQADRVAPKVTAAWHGRVYGTTDNGPLVLDARTGEDTPARPGIAPVLLNESAGIALDDAGDNLLVYSTSG
ncbi:PQQ-binding-like beta-propeller repeat protein [Streptomyces sp. NBC_00203]|uniref:outer membrane protein assembly factor BamB family protein n=1 Tax=Streptomyces sp. NBC_00203 TaxID=2975680 RepID=UPI003255DD03